MSHPVRIPADVDREDRLLANLTARQVALLAAVGAVLYLAWAATRPLVPLALFALIALPLGAAAVAVVLGRRDGLSLDRFLLAALRHRTSPARRITAPEGVGTPPGWLAARATDSEPGGLAPLALAARTVTGSGPVGLVDCGADGIAVLAVASTVHFGLRTADEQDALVAVFARYLHSLTAPVQILVRAMPVDLTDQIHELHTAANDLAHPALARAARKHAAFLAGLGERMDLLTRQVVLVLREPLITAGPVDGLGGAGPLALATSRRTARREGRRAGDAARRSASTRLARRLTEATDLLAPAGIVLTPLDAGTATSVLAAACNPAGLVPPAGLAAPDDVITAEADLIAGLHDPPHRNDPTDDDYPDSDDDPWPAAPAAPSAQGWVPDVSDPAGADTPGRRAAGAAARLLSARNPRDLEGGPR